MGVFVTDQGFKKRTLQQIKRSLQEGMRTIHGTGLGLYIAHELCRANDGQLEYVPVPGGGACFRITLRSGSVMLG